MAVGLVVGGLPLAAGLLLGQLCAAAPGTTICLASLLSVGAGAGVLLGVLQARRPRPANWFTTGSIAALTASLGCARLGGAGLATVMLGLALGAALTAVIGRRRA